MLGILFFVPGVLLPYGIGMLGIGIILLALNLARYLSHISPKGFSITLGVLALLEGAVSLLRALAGIQLKLPFFPILLIVIGAILLIRAATRMKVQALCKTVNPHAWTTRLCAAVPRPEKPAAS